MFEGYKLIFLTAKGFCSYAIDEELTPILYKLAISGFVCENYYVPLWSTSTSDGEYDSRMYAGRDILSDREEMVIFKNLSVNQLLCRKFSKNLL